MTSKRLVVIAASALIAAFCSPGLLQGQEQSYAISGILVTPHGIVNNGVVMISHGSIQGVGPDIPIPRGTTLINTEGVIFPGLIDLHNHLIWNVFPRWKPDSPVGDRYEWQAMSDYAAKLSGPEAALVDRGDGCDMERFAEIKAMLGGATSVVGSFSPTEADPHRNDCDRGLARNLDYFSGLYSSTMNAEPLENEVFPFEIPYPKAQAILDSMSSGRLKALLLHVSEGKDAGAAREFRMLRARGFVRPGVSVIHGTALHDPDFREMAANGVGLIWSPRSNIALYGVTTNVASAKDARVTIAIAPDWSPSGSNGMVEELRYAYKWNNGQIPKVFDAPDFVQMATQNPAKLAGVADKIGSLAAGTAADIVVFPKRDDSPLKALLDAEPGSVMLVVVGGKPMLGDPEIMQRLLPDNKLESLSVCRYTKSLNIAEDTGGEPWSQISSHLASELHLQNLSLADLVDCNDGH